MGGVRVRKDGLHDWRSLPRRDKDYRDRYLSFRLTAEEKSGICALAEFYGLSLSDYVISRALRRTDRVDVDPEEEVIDDVS